MAASWFTDNLNTSLNSIKSQVTNSLKDVFDEQNENLNSEDDEVSRLLALNTTLEKHNKELEEQKEVQCIQFRELLREKEYEISLLKEQVEQSSSKNDEWNNDFDINDNPNNEYEEEEKDRIQEKVDQLSRELHQKETQVQSLHEELEALRMSTKKLESELEQSNKPQVSEEDAALKEKLLSILRTGLDSETEETNLENFLKIFMTKFHESRKSQMKLQEEISALQQKIQGDQDDLNITRNQNQDFKSQIETLTQKLEKDDINLQTIQRELTSTKEEKRGLLDQLREKEKEMEAQKIEISTVSKNRDDVREEVEKLRKKSEIEQNTSNDFQTQLHNFTIENEQLKDQIKELEKVIENGRKEEEEILFDTNPSAEQTRESDIEIEKLISINEAQEAECSELKIQVNDLSLETDQLKNQIKELEKVIEDGSEEEEDAKAIKEQLKIQVDNLSLENKRLEDEVKELKKVTEENDDNETNKSIEELRETVEENEIEIATLKDQNEVQKAHCSELKIRVDNLNIENVRLIHQIEKLEKVLEDKDAGKKAKERTTIEKLTKRIEESDKEILSLRSINEAREAECSKLKGYIEDLNVEKQSFQTELKSLEEKCKNVETKLEHSHKEMENTKREADEIQVRFQDNLSQFQGNDQKLKDLEIQAESYRQEVSVAGQTIQRLSGLVRDKDLEIDSLNSKNESLVSVLQQQQTESEEIQNKIQTLLSERQEMIDALQQKHQESLRYHGEVQRLSQLLILERDEPFKSEKRRKRRFLSESFEPDHDGCIESNDVTKRIREDKEISELKLKVSSLAEENQELVKKTSSLDISLKEKQHDLIMAQKNLQQLTTLLEENKQSSEFHQREKIEHVTALQELRSKITELERRKEEFDERNTIKDRELLALRKEVNNVIDKKRKLEQELERLANHLVAVEESYTQDAVEAKSRENELRKKLNMTEEALRISSVQHSSASQEAHEITGSLEQRVINLTKERDELHNRVQILQRDYEDQGRSLDNLQLALESFQSEQENQSLVTEQHYQQRLQIEVEKHLKYESQIKDLEEKLNKANESLAAAGRLGDQLERKSNVIATLKHEIQLREESLKRAQKELEQINENNSGKVDRSLIKNLMVGFVAADDRKRPDILKIVATVLDFNHEERLKTGLEGHNSGCNSRDVISSGKVDQSLTSAFVQFLESESKPKTLPKLLPEDSSNNPQSANNTVPTFSANRSSSSILKHVLQDEEKK